MKQIHFKVKRIFAVVLLLIGGAFTAANATTYTVTNTGDNGGTNPAANAGTGTLRQAIIDANANPGADNINFNIAGAGVQTITLSALLPLITGPTTINGYSQTGALQGSIGSRTILIGINGNATITASGGRGVDGLFRFTSTASNSSLSGLAIYHTGSSVEAVMIEPGNSNIQVWGNYIGVLPSGVSPAASNFNGDDGIFIGSNTINSGTFNNITIGTNGDGTNDANEGNVIANSVEPTDGGDGIQIGSTSGIYTWSNIKVSGNYIGVAADGVTAAPNGLSTSGTLQANGQDGINLLGVSNVLIGSDGNGMSDVLERNIISGNAGNGIDIYGSSASSSISIAGNYIGTDKAGTAAVPNGIKSTSAVPFCGILVSNAGGGNASGVVIGFDDTKHTAATAAAIRNIVSGNYSIGIQFSGITGTSNKIAGNYIGVDANGNTGLGNGQYNIAHPASVVFSNGIDVYATTNLLIGTNANGINDSYETNIISGNIDARGVYIRNGSSLNVVAGNYIGVGADGTTAIGNDFAGVHIDVSGNNRIGSNDDGTNDAAEANIIANNAKSTNASNPTSDGVRITGNATQNRISRNIFYNNKTTPIDLANDGVSVNDGVTTAAQPNILLDYPVFTAYNISGTTMTVSGYVGQCNGTETVPGTVISGTTTVQVYKVANDGDQNGAISNNGCSRSVAHGEGVQYLGSITVTNGVFTNTTFTLVPGASFALGDKITGITIDANGNTSEFGVDAAPVGYIYVHKKALDETSSIDFPFTVSGGSTVVPNFNLNDKDDQIPLQDIGASQGGRLWAVGTNNILYYRDLGSSSWVATSVTDAYRVDGGTGNSCYYLRTTFEPYYFDGVTSTLLGNLVAFGGVPARDIGNAWDNKPYIVNNSGQIWQYSGGGTTWTQIGVSTDNQRIDGNPANGNAVVSKTDNNVYSITSAGVSTSLGKPANSTGATIDIAVASDGSVFASYASSTLLNAYAFKWISGTTWSTEEITSRNYVNTIMTAGLGGQVWGLYTAGLASSVTNNIFTRTFDGTTTLWLNDERVRTTVTGNSVMIAVNPGTYTITELVPAGWDLQHLYVYDPTNNSSTSVTGNMATIAVAAGETVTAVFENGMVNPFAMTNSCATAYLEDFGTGAAGTYGPALVGQTSYHYQTTGNTLANNYKIVGNANMLFGGAANLTDHTAGDGQGRMMAVDANNEQDAFFRRRFTGIIPGANYTFSAWIANINAGATIKPNVTFEVIDPTTYTVLQSVNTGNITSNAIWTKYGLTITVPSGITTFDLVIRNNGQGGTGNDLVIDDISLALIPVSTPVTTVANTGCGTSGSITVTSPVGASYEYSKDGFATAAQSSPVFSNLAPGTYTISARFVGTLNCITSKVDVIAATICGNIWDDANGNAANSSENPITSGVWVNLVDPVTHAVLQSVQVDASGNYSFTGLPQNTSYQVILTTTNQTGNLNLTTATIPTGYVATGTNLSGVANTSNKTGVITVNTGAGGITQQNFGIEKLPDTDPKTQTVPYPNGGIIPAGTVTTAVSGTDFEDGTLGNSNTIVITSLPANATMYYNGIAVTAGQQITGFNPALVSFGGITNGSTSVVFNYAFIDAAGKQDPTPASYTLNWLGALPVILESFTATKENDKVRLSWRTLTEQNVSKFTIEYSKDGNTFTAIADVAAAGNSSVAVNYTWLHTNPIAGNNYYRLKMIDLDGKYIYIGTNLVKINRAGEVAITVYPNPVNNTLTISLPKPGTVNTMLHIYSNDGKLVYSRATGNAQTIPVQVNTLANGVYYIRITVNEKTQYEAKFIKQ
ncbi:T9SS type A sorting domain-containing protein [Ferruginibacter sp. SUN106]|uniref:T9SS type A sorting domain-containing protein n=1 Tax=Ferruginibacter sp. SUN106 TaxID=2978348 RepID=UPI003D36F847